ncbi:major facilitator superfamily domain-containing protein [Podospora appendiculata]|uniref:Major facilitator superfamily domain-containing protein n=1 Tax=Podospora appendiculata TaxID=314037 RepID=A0AAE1CE76_9PEZI|nr:major facilitator superfamily domain-containing protein [Podospora appendiculata]
MSIHSVDPEKAPVLAPDVVAEPASGETSESEKKLTTSDILPVADGFVPPDGGAVAWMQVFAMFLICTISWGTPSAFGVYQLYYVDTLRLTQSKVSWIGSMQFLLTYGMCTFSGRLADAGYIKSTIGVGAFLTVFGTFMTSLGSEYWHFFLSQGVCVGLGLGTMFMPPLAVASSYFTTRRTMALTCAATGTSIGSVIFPSMIQYLIPQVGFGWAVRVTGFFSLACTGTALLLLKPRLKPRKSGPLVEWNSFKEPPYLLYSIGVFLLYWALFFGSFYINSFARNIIGFSTVDSVQLLLLSNGMSIPARPVAGYIANWHVGAMNTYIVSNIGFGIVTLAWIAVHDRAGMYVLAIFFGLANGICQGLFLASMASLTSDPRKMGTRMGMVHTIVGFATLAGPPTAGAIIDSSGGKYTYAQIWAGLLIIVATGLFVSSRIAKTGLVWKVKI